MARDSSSSDVAVVGYGVRASGVNGPDEFWRALVDEQCLIRDIPSSRWSSTRFSHPNPDMAGTSYINRAGIVDNLFDFDAGYFGISPREAAQMDPQQRLLLEVTAEALAHAGVVPDTLCGPSTGIYIGASSLDHGGRFAGEMSRIDSGFMLGNTLSIHSNRLAYFLDAQGPSYTVDTACSSSAFALHQACEALRQGEIETAVVGGVNALLSPLPFIGFSRASMLSPDGLCKAFDTDANGYVRAEGAVVFILKRKAETGDLRTRSVILGTGTNTDGRTAGMSMPSVAGQTALIKRISESLQLDANDLAFVEAHGTGTPVGDPVEAEAIGTVYGSERGAPLPIGSAKTNFGHLEPASGLIGLLKAQLALENNHLPASLHVNAPNPNIDFEGLNLNIAGQSIALEDRQRPWLAAVNSFGFGGANAHAVLRQPWAHENQVSSDLPTATTALTLSAASSESLSQLVKNWSDDLGKATPVEAATRINNANHHQARLARRIVVTGQNAAEIAKNISNFADGVPSPNVQSGQAYRDGSVGFVFSGNGAQWAGMGRHLFETDNVFNTAFCEVSDLVVSWGGLNLCDLLVAPDLEAELKRSTICQPMHFALQVALVETLRHAGIVPSATAGHSAGEVAAAWCAGALSLPDAVHLICSRAVTLEAIRGTGSMAALLCSRDQGEELLQGLDLCISAENSPRSLTISGPTGDLKKLCAKARKQRIAAKILGIEYPYHSAEVERIEPRLREDLARIEPQQSDIPYFSATTGAQIETSSLNADYWWQNARQPVKFRQAIENMARFDVQVLLEVGAKTVLKTYVTDTLEAAGSNATLVTSLDQGSRETVEAREIAAEVVANGGLPDCHRFRGRPVPFQGGLPRYPWAHETHEMTRSADAVDLYGEGKQDHPLLGARLRQGEGCWHAEVDANRLPWLADHKVDGVIVLPAACILDILTSLGSQVWEGGVEIAELDILQAVTFDAQHMTELRTSFDETTGAVRIESRHGSDAKNWQICATATVRKAPETAATPWNDTYERDFDIGELYRLLGDCHLDYGPSFRLNNAIKLGVSTAKTTLSPPVSGHHSINPMSLDAALHVLYPLTDEMSDHPLKPGETILPIRMEGVRVHRIGAELCSAHLRVLEVGKIEVKADLQLLDRAGDVVLEIRGLRLKKISLRSAETPFRSWITKQTRLRLDNPVSLPQGWEDPMERLAALGLLADENTPSARSVSDIGLLIDAATRRLVWERLRGRGPISADTEIKRICIEALDADGLTSPCPGGARVSEECSYPDIPTLLGELTRIAPDTSLEQKTLLQIDQALAKSLNGDMLHQTPSTRTRSEMELWDIAQRILDDLGEEMLATFVVGLGGNPSQAFIKKLQKHCDHVFLCDAISDDPQQANKPANKPVDLLISVNKSLKSGDYSLSSGGLHVALHADRDLFETLRYRLLKLEMLPAAKGAQLATEHGEARISCVRAASNNAGGPLLPPMHVIGTCPEIVSAGPETEDWLIVCPKYDQSDPVEYILNCISSLKVATRKSPRRLWITIGHSAAESAIAALSKVLCNEGIETHVIQGGPDLIKRLASAMEAARKETSIELTPDAATTPRIEPFVPPEPCEGDGWQLDQKRSGDPDTIFWKPKQRLAPKSEEVEVEVSATGLNFRDVLWAQGLLPEEALSDGFTGPSLGMEFSGVVRRSGTAEMPEGTPVMGFSPAAFSSHITAPASTLCRVPDGIDAELAAAIPTVFVTALYGLEDLARLQKGETVLIHGAAGGVGLAALQVAKRIGARVVATAGTPEKRRLLEGLGAEVVLDSRSMAFADHIRDMGGVDVVLNSLWGEAMERSIGCLKPFGRFVELGKRDFYANNRVGLRPFRRNLSYFALDADQLFCARPDLLQDLMSRLSSGFASHSYHIPPCQVFDADECVDAFRLMQRSGHIGKILIRPPQSPPETLEKPDYSGTWLITGGLGGFGLATAEFLAAKGADRLVLTSRKGEIAEDICVQIERHGAKVQAVAADITDRNTMETLVAETGPLKGVIHAAMVLDDALFADTDPTQIEAVLSPKINGMDILEAATQAAPPRYFICYSSIATLIANPGQSAYVAANAYLEERMRARKRARLHGLAIGWGPLADVGILARDPDQREMIAGKLGAPLLKAADALEALDRFLTCAEPVVSFSPMNWGRLAKDLPVLNSNLTERLDLTQSTTTRTTSLSELIKGLSPSAAQKKVTQILQAETSTILKLPASEIDPLRPLADLGFDSLMALNLRMVAEEKYGVQLPLIALMDGTTLAQASATLLNSLSENEPADDVMDAIQATHGKNLNFSADVQEEFRKRAPAAKRLSS